MRHVRKPVLRPIRSFLSLAALALGCAELPGQLPGDESGVSSQALPLNGQVVFVDSSCNFGIRADKVRTAMRIAGEHLRTPVMEECLRQAIISYTEFGYPEDILSRMRADMPTHVNCANIGGAQAPGDISDERITLGNDFIDNNNEQVMASVILHEIAHNKGYHHPTPANVPPNWPLNLDPEDNKHSVPEHLRVCSHSISTSGFPTPNGLRRGDLPMETTLAPTGRNGGAPFQINCPAGQKAFGLQLRDDDRVVTAVGLSCRPVAGGDLTDTVMAGGGDPQTHTFNDCFEGEVLVGIHGRAGVLNDAAGPICARVTDVRAGIPTVFRDAQQGGSGGAPTDRLCPLGMVVRAIKGKAGVFVDRLEVECQQLDRTESVAERDLEPVGGSGGSATREKCPGRSALVALNFQTGARVDRLGGTCNRIETSGTTDNIFGDPIHMPGHGGTGGILGQQNARCGGAFSRSVLVGLQIRADSSTLIAVGGRCADAAGWSNPSNNITPVDLPMNGGSGGTLRTPTCPRGEFMIGWTIRAGNLVDQVRPICRDFR
jgi:hypothetical protein